MAKDFAGLLEAQGMLYNLAKMHPPQKDLPAIIGRLQGLGIHTLVLTSRGPEFRVATERELRQNGYDFSRHGNAGATICRAAIICRSTWTISKQTG